MELMSKLHKIAAVVVTYNPGERFNQLLSALVHQVDITYVVDNGSDEPLQLPDPQIQNTHSILLDKNYGIAKAQNVGITAAIEENAEFILLLDHDSIPSQNMVERLMREMLGLLASGKPVAAIGPRYVDKRQNNPPPFVSIQGLSVKRLSCELGVSVVPVSYLIASGSLIPVETLQKVGLMREELFVDYVDIEWGMRAAEIGYQSYGVCDAYMDHDLGDKPINFLGKKIPLHSPLRHYYLFRNAIYLYKSSYLPWTWKVGDFYRLLLKYGFYTIFAKPRFKHFCMMTIGIWDGLVGNMGQYSR